MWYYTEGALPVGPLYPRELCERPGVTTATYVWKEGLPEWLPLANVPELAALLGERVPVSAPLSTVAPIEEAPLQRISRPIRRVPSAMSEAQAEIRGLTEGEMTMRSCCDCGRTFSTRLMVKIESQWVCAECKPLYLQKLTEGVIRRKDMTLNYAGFITRMQAYIYDYIIVSAAAFFPSVGLNILINLVGSAADKNTVQILEMLSSFIVQIFASVFYGTILVTLRGATFGQSQLGIQIVTLDGRPLQFGMAFLRSICNLLTYLSLGLGFLTPLFDPEKRALSDFLCGTRVIYTRKEK